MDEIVLGILGASGGLGTSTLAVSTASRGGDRHGVTVAVDAELGRGGLDVTACIEHREGLRWPDLAALEGEVDAGGLLRSLPSDRTCRVLAAGGGREGAGPLARPPDTVVQEVVRALAGVVPLVVVDLGTHGARVDLCTDVVLVAGTSVRHLADAASMASSVRDGPRTSVVLRLPRRPGGGAGVDPEAVAYHLDLPLVATVAHDARVAADPLRGRMPGTRRADAVGVAADRVLDHVLGARPARAG